MQNKSATTAGLLLIPMMFGLIISSAVSGALVTKTGHYKAYPIIGSALMILGLGLLSLFKPDSGEEVFIPFLFIAGAGMGLIMSISTLAAQNQVDLIDMGVATSTVTFFRTIGGVFGVRCKPSANTLRWCSLV